MTPQQYADAVAGEVRAEMGKQRKTQAELAKVLGMTTATAGRRLSAEVPFDVIELVSVSEWLGVDVERFTNVAGAAKASA